MDGADDNDLEVDETNPDGLGQLWEDDDTKSFYEILIDLLEIVPAILYKDSKAQVEIQVRSISIQFSIFFVNSFDLNNLSYQNILLKFTSYMALNPNIECDLDHIYIDFLQGV